MVQCSTVLTESVDNPIDAGVGSDMSSLFPSFLAVLPLSLPPPTLVIAAGAKNPPTVVGP